jgi:hypothetical protein
MTLDELNQHNILCETNKKLVGPGPWLDEVNRYNWRFAALDCMIIRHPEMLHWCGYVGVSKKHPYFGKHYDVVEVSVHGGLTYSHECQDSICHLDDSGESVWWFGFDCAHSGDLSPKMNMLMEKFSVAEKIPDWMKRETDLYWTQSRVMKETNNLAQQLGKVAA